MRLPILILVHIATAHRVDLDLTQTTGEGSNTSSTAPTALQNSTAVVGTHCSDRGVLSRAGPAIPAKLMQRLALILAVSSVLGGPLPAVEAKAMPTAFVAPRVPRNALSGSGFRLNAMEAAGPGSGIPVKGLDEIGAAADAPGNVKAPVSHQILNVQLDLTGEWTGLGIVVDNAEKKNLLIEEIIAGGAVAIWNANNPGKAVSVGDRIVEVNGKGGDAQLLLSGCKDRGLLQVAIQKARSEGAGVQAAQASQAVSGSFYDLDGGAHQDVSEVATMALCAASKDGKLEMGYWAMRGLGAPCRMMLEHAALDYTDNQYNEPGQWFGPRKEEIKKLNPLANLPYLIDGDECVCQTNAVLSYLGDRCGLNGNDGAERLLIVQVLEEVYDLRNRVFELTYPFKEVCRDQAEHDTKLAAHLGGGAKDNYAKFEDSVKGPFLLGEEICTGDFHLFEMLDQHEIMAKKTGAESLLTGYPKLTAFHAAFKAAPTLAKYFASDSYKLPLNNPLANTYQGEWAETPAGEAA